MFRKKLLATLLLVAMVSSVAVFASGSSEEVSKNKEVSIWSFNLSNDALKVVKEQIIAKYEAENPGVKVEWQNIPYTGYREKLLTAAAGSSLPDIFIDGYNMVGTYHSAGIIEDLSDRAKNWSGWNDIDQSLIDLTYYEDGYYGMPFRTKVYPVVINTEIFEECGLDPDNPPSTWAEVIEAGKKMVKVENGVVTRMGASGFINVAQFTRGFDLFVQQDGGNFLNEDGTPGFNDQHGLNAMKFLNDLYRVHCPVGAIPLDESSIDPFVAGKSGMAVMSSYDAIQTALQTNNKDVPRFAKVIPPFESGSATGKRVSLFDGDMMYMSVASPNKEAAWNFIEYFYQPEIFIQYVEANKVVPIYQSQLDSEYMQNNPLLQGLMEMQQYGGNLAATPAYRSARGYLADEIDKSFEQGQSYQDTLDEAERMWLREIEDLK